MAEFRAFHEGVIPPPGESLRLDSDESRHLLQVLRVRPGDTVEVLNGQGLRSVALIEGQMQRAVLLRIERTTEESPDPVEVTLLQALPKGKTFDTIIRQATEIGVRRIIPLLSDHSEVRLTLAQANSKQAHWRRTAHEACKQCGNAWRPEITLPLSLKEALAVVPDEAFLMVASLQSESVPVMSNAGLIAGASSVVVGVGPEGDFSSSEYALLKAHHFRPVRLARQILRSDTAAAYLLSVVDALKFPIC